MKKIFLGILIIFVFSNSYAQITVNGILDSTVSVRVNDGEISYGVEEFANIRFQSRLRDNRAVVYGAVNLIAAAGNTALAMVVNNPSGLVVGEDYVAAIELERLYFRLNFEKANFDAGLFRLPFGYSQVWGSSDFLNPRNPLRPDARPRGILGAALSVFPYNDIKLTGFAATSREPYFSGSNGFRTGFFAENHWNSVSAQGLYTFELSDNIYWDGDQYRNSQIHRAGLSLKADIVVGIVLDALYTYVYEKRFGVERENGIDGLSFSAGLDYSFVDGRLIVLAEYLYNGENSSTARKPLSNPLGMFNRHYLYTSLTWLFNDFTNAGIALISCLDELEYTPILTFNHDLFQGASLMIMAQAPINSDLIDNGNFDFNLSARLRLRF